MSSTALELATAAAQIDTVAQLRAAMGAVTQTLQQGYQELSIFGPATSVPNLVEGTSAAAKSLLDTVNASAQALYNIYTDEADLQDEEISTYHAHMAGVVISEANDALASVEQAIGSNFSNVAQAVSDALTAIGQIAGKIAGTTLQSATNAIAAGASAFVTAAWPTLVVVGVAVIAYVFRRPLVAAIGGAL